MKRYVIIGAGAAGIAAAESIRNLDRASEIVCISAEKQGYYSRPGLAYFLSKELGEKSLYPFSRSDFKARGINFYHNHVNGINSTNHEIILQDGRKMRYDRLLVATGAAAVRPSIEGVDLDGVVYLDSLAQTRLMIKQARRQRKAVVVGGGITAIEIVEGLNARGVAVDFFIRGERYWNRVLDEIESGMIESRLRHDGVKIHKNTEVAKIIGRNGRVTGVATKDGRLHRTEMVAFAIGVLPRVGLAKKSGLEAGRGVRVNEYLETSAQDVYAAGDVTESFDPVSEGWIIDSLWNPARNQGHVAGMNMAGEQRPYLRENALNVTRLTGLTTTIIGRVGTGEKGGEEDLSIVRGESEAWQQMPDAVLCQNSFDVNRLRVMVGKTKLEGALLMGDQSLSKALEDLVREGVDISSIRDSLVTSGADLGSILFNYWQRWRQFDAN